LYRFVRPRFGTKTATTRGSAVAGTSACILLDVLRHAALYIFASRCCYLRVYVVRRALRGIS